MSVNKALACSGIGIALLLSGCTENSILRPSLNKDITHSDTKVIGTVAKDNQIKIELPVEQAALPLNTIIDWTPFLKPMMSGCRFPSLYQELPQIYRQSINSVYKKGDPTLEEDSFTTTYKLKNTIAFGYSIASIEHLEGYEWSRMKLFFEDSDFIKLRSQFEPPKVDEYSEVVENNSLGYEHISGAYTSLKFNTKEKSITCESGI